MTFCAEQAEEGSNQSKKTERTCVEGRRSLHSLPELLVSKAIRSKKANGLQEAWGLMNKRAVNQRIYCKRLRGYYARKAIE
jgi:hypothetical protein